MLGSFLSETRGFTPVIDAVVKDVGLVTAVVYGVVWRYCQMKDKACKASIETIAERAGVDRKTAERHIKKLCAAGYLKDLTPDRKNAPHEYADTGKAKISALVSGEGKTESPNPKEVGQKVEARSDLESGQGKTESPTKIPSEDSFEDTKNPSGQNTPTNFQEWLTAIKESKNRPAILRWMVWELYPDKYETKDDVPGYGYLGKVAKKVGGAGRLADLLWQHSTRPPTGDVLAFVQVVAKGKKGSKEPYAGIKEWAAEQEAMI